MIPQPNFIRVRRYAIVYVLLLLTCWASCKVAYARWLKPYLAEQAALSNSLNGENKMRYGSYGNNVNPFFTDLIQVAKLPESLLPHPADRKHGKHGKERRLIFVGDVHGCRTELVRLLEKLAFDKSHDHLVFTGDLIAKGPHSTGVIDLVSSLNASCVRGNHDDRVLLSYRSMGPGRVQPFSDSPSETSTPDDTAADAEKYPHRHTDHRILARSLSPAQAAYLSSCPVILDVGSIPGLGNLVTVHAGLVPGIGLQHQDPTDVMTMRSIDLDTHTPSETRSGVQWTKLWNHYQKHQVSRRSQHTTVVYGHDSHRGLQLGVYTKGLDSGCVGGGRLTALVLVGHAGNKARQKVVSVKCHDYREKHKR